ncbi:hypothetical protein H696_04776 [Fonticula alba]|uniref:Structural maintenance of chromosomes protein n=1 Tax=Fonticula alba TaxID=691883 RepID=A0A058Z3M0_FONAL|nr:hypothetical protein H696_04776 [Fonticula alba]KCV68483.1 hypothetical protein H696_04776 [Fonticula alba]|eukprot:XP_009496915.1 hypothetical protein H696_04776 [Fonticula alba]
MSSPPPSKRRATDTPAADSVAAELAPPVESAPPAEPAVATEPAPPADAHRRMVITHLVLENFKSYAGKVTIGPFHASFTAVVGPNGSGKSNVIDSMLFVFGYRAKAMRQGKLGELIHHSAAFPNLTYCKVSVHFADINVDPSHTHEYLSKTIPILPGSQFVVSRIAYKNNTSRYFIDERSSTYTEVTELLRFRGIDLDHKRFLILQGEVESISQMKPKAPSEHEDGLLEYLEDIIGTSSFKGRIEEAEVALEALSDQRAEKQNRLQIVEKDRDALLPKYEEAVDFLVNEAVLVHHQRALFEVYVREARESLDSVQDRMDTIKRKMKAEQARNRELAQTLKAAEEAHERETAEVDRLTRAIVRQRQEYSAHERDYIKIQENLKHTADRMRRTEKALEKAQRSIGTHEGWIKTYTQDVEKILTEIDERREQLKSEEQQLDVLRESLTSETKPLQIEVEAKQKELAPWLEKASRLQNAISEAESELRMISERNSASERMVQRLEQQRAANRASLTEAAGRREHLLKESENLRLQQQLAGKNVEALAAQEPVLMRAYQDAQMRLDDALASVNQQRNRGSLLTGLMQFAKEQNMPGVFGRLGDLGIIDARFDVAATTSYPLDHMVVDTAYTAQRCISHMKERNLGRTTFIVLDSIGAPRPKPPTPENADRLFDLIQVQNPLFLKAFYFAYGDTLVANDMQHASRLAYGARRFRVVTLGGEVIDTSGIMSGGGNVVMRGGIASSFGSRPAGAGPSANFLTPAEIDSLRQKANQAREEHAQCSRDLAAARARLDQIVRSLDESSLSLPKVEMEINSLESVGQSLDQQVQEAQRAAAPVVDHAQQVRVEELRRLVDTERTELKATRASAASIEQAIKALQDRILEVGGIKIRHQQAQVELISTMITNANDRLNAARVKLAQEENSLRKAASSVDELQRELGDLTSQHSALETNGADKNRAGAELKKAIAESQENLDAKRDTLTELLASLEDSKKKMLQCRSVEVELQQQLEDASRAVEEARRKVASWVAKRDAAQIPDLAGLGEAAVQRKQERCAHLPDAAALVAFAAGIDPEVTVSGRSVVATGGDGDVDMADAEALPEPGAGAARDGTPDDDAMVVDEAQGGARPAAGADPVVPLLADADRIARIKQAVQSLQSRLENARPNLGIIEQYQQTAAELEFRSGEFEQADRSRRDAKQEYDSLRARRLELFTEGFGIISRHLKEMYQMITLGGNAELELVDSMDPFSEGIIFSVMPPKKSWKNIANLSGGEKTLSSLALIFALHLFKPTPLFILDEIDAALDFRNVSIVGSYIKERTQNAQFIVISLRNNLFELADRLVGVFKTNSTSKSVSINPRLIEARARLHILKAPPATAEGAGGAAIGGRRSRADSEDAHPPEGGQASAGSLAGAMEAAGAPATPVPVSLTSRRSLLAATPDTAAQEPEEEPTPSAPGPDDRAASSMLA